MVNNTPIAGIAYSTIVSMIKQTPQMLTLHVVPKECDVLQMVSSLSGGKLSLIAYAQLRFILFSHTALYKHCSYAGIESFDHVHLLLRSSSSGRGSDGAFIGQWWRHQIHIISTAATVDLISRCCRRPIIITDNLRSITGSDGTGTGAATWRQSLWQHHQQCQRQWQQWPTAATAASATTAAAASASVASSGVKQRQQQHWLWRHGPWTATASAAAPAAALPAASSSPAAALEQLYAVSQVQGQRGVAGKGRAERCCQVRLILSDASRHRLRRRRPTGVSLSKWQCLVQLDDVGAATACCTVVRWC